MSSQETRPTGVGTTWGINTETQSSITKTLEDQKGGGVFTQGSAAAGRHRRPLPFAVGRAKGKAVWPEGTTAVRSACEAPKCPTALRWSSPSRRHGPHLQCQSQTRWCFSLLLLAQSETSVYPCSVPLSRGHPREEIKGPRVLLFSYLLRWTQN